MRYILNDEGYIETVSFTYEVECNNKTCTEYTGSVPAGYETLADWNENANINAYKVVNGELTYDSDKDTELQSLWESQMQSQKATGDSLPIGAIVEYEGDTIPEGYEEAIDEKDYSTTEQRVGTWINGKPLYRKIIDIGALPNSTAKNVAHSISNIDRISNFYGVAMNSSKHTLHLPHINPTNLSYGVLLQVSRVNIEIETGYDRTSYSGYVTIEYTKTTD